MQLRFSLGIDFSFFWKRNGIGSRNVPSKFYFYWRVLLPRDTYQPVKNRSRLTYYFLKFISGIVQWWLPRSDIKYTHFLRCTMLFCISLSCIFVSITLNCQTFGLIAVIVQANTTMLRWERDNPFKASWNFLEFLNPYNWGQISNILNFSTAFSLTYISLLA